MAARSKIGDRIRGALMQNKDWWHYVVEDDGKSYIEHEWSHTDPYGKGRADSGMDRISVDAFLTGNASNDLKAKVRELTKKSTV